MSDESSEDGPILPLGGASLPSPDTETRPAEARSIVSIAIGKLRRWRSEYLRDDAGKQYDELGTTIEQAMAVLVELDDPKISQERLRDIMEAYTALIQRTPSLPSEVPKQFGRSFPGTGYDYDTDI